MNRDERRKLEQAMRRYCSASLQAEAEFSDIVADLQQREEQKLDNLPENLKDTEQAERISKAAELLSSISDSLEAIGDLRNEIVDEACIDISDIRTLLAKKTAACSEDAGANRFQLLLSDQSLCLMRLRSLQLGISCNELIRIALRNELLKDPNE